MSKIKIITDNKWRNLHCGYEVPKRKRKDFDYINPDEFDSYNFIKYRNSWYDVGEFMIIGSNPDNPLHGWHGYSSDTYFSGVVIRLSEDCEQYQIGRYYS